MTEEKRIIEHNGIGLVIDKSKKLLDFINLKQSEVEPTPVTFTELDLAVSQGWLCNNDVFTEADVQDRMQYVLYFIGVKTMWDKYSKSIPQKTWYVKVPHTTPDNQCFYYKYGIDIRPGSVRPSFMSGSESKFTNSEIKKYHLQDCEKVPADD